MLWIGAGIAMNPALQERAESGVEISLHRMLSAAYAGDPSVITTPHHKPGFLSGDQEKLLAPRKGDAVVLSAAVLAQNATVAYSALNDALKPHPDISAADRSAGIKAAKKACAVVDLHAKRLFASHAWTGTHQCGDFGAKIASAYCLIRVHNAAITASGRDVNYNEGKGEGRQGKVMCALGAKSAGVVFDGKHCKRRKTSRDEDEEEQGEEDDALEVTDGKGGQGGSGGNRLKKGSSGQGDE